MYDLPSECNTGQKNVIFSGTLNLLEPELSFSLKTFSLDPTFAELKDTKQNQQLWSRDKVLEKNCFGFTVAGELNWICEG